MKKLGIVILILCMFFVVYGFYTGLEITHYTYRDHELPQKFDGYRIAFISDLHCKEIGKKQKKLIRTIVACKPNMVVFTGDMIDGDHEDITAVKELLAGLKGRYPMYAVSGNHERDILNNYDQLQEYYREFGVINLDDSSYTISFEGAHIGIYGKPYLGGYYSEDFLRKPDKDKNEFNILLFHDSTAFIPVSLRGYNLVLSGHTHGGIIRLPFLGGIINNNGSLHPEFDNGMYVRNGSTLISNRGIGDADFPRYYNRPEVVCITLRVRK